MTTHQKCQMANCSKRAVRRIKLKSTLPEIADPKIKKRKDKFRVCNNCFLIWTKGNESYGEIDLFEDEVRRSENARNNSDDEMLEMAIAADVLGQDLMVVKKNDRAARTTTTTTAAAAEAKR